MDGVCGEFDWLAFVWFCGNIGRLFILFIGALGSARPEYICTGMRSV